MLSMRLSRGLGLTAIWLAAAAVAGCGPLVATRGNLVEDQRLATVQPGVSTKSQVAGTLGTPTTVAPFDENTWYYIGQRTERRAFFDPKIVERRVVTVQFDPQGVVQSVEQKGLDSGQEVQLVDRETPTLGRQLTFLEQMLGNFARSPGRAGGGRAPGDINIPGR